MLSYNVCTFLVSSGQEYYPFLLAVGNPVSVAATHIQGMPGCRNVRAGGDNVKSSLNQDDVFMCYFVYRSFKEKPAN